jgi:hypothetical protein
MEAEAQVHNFKALYWELEHMSPLSYKHIDSYDTQHAVGDEQQALSGVRFASREFKERELAVHAAKARLIAAKEIAGPGSFYIYEHLCILTCSSQ